MGILENYSDTLEAEISDLQDKVEEKDLTLVFVKTGLENLFQNVSDSYAETEIAKLIVMIERNVSSYGHFLRTT